METGPQTMIPILTSFAPLFSKPVFAHVQLLVAGAILAPGKRTITALLRVIGKGEECHFQTYHRVLNRDRWSPLKAASLLLAWLLITLAPAGALVFGIDDTIERRRGAKIRAKGIYRDPVRSSQSHFVKASGLRWIVMALLVEIPWAKRVWALPFLTVLAPSERYHQERGRQHKTVVDWARQMITLVRRWCPDRAIVVVADQTYAVLRLLDRCRQLSVTLVTRLRLDAALYDPAPPREPGQIGRPRRKGQRQPTLQQRLNDPTTEWNRVKITDWYGTGARTVEVATGTAVWYHGGEPVVPIRWVLVRPLPKEADGREPFEPQALLCTDLGETPEQVLVWFVRRWTMEVTFEEARAHLGIETQRQWNDRAIARTTPALLGLYSLVTLGAHRGAEKGELRVRRAAWYPKELPTFSDALACIRRQLWTGATLRGFETTESIFTSGLTPDRKELHEPLSPAIVSHLIETLCYAN
jgi:hypothetical protein